MSSESGGSSSTNSQEVPNQNGSEPSTMTTDQSNTSVGHVPPAKHYANVKMKYFQTLGVQQHQLPTPAHSVTAIQHTGTRQRTKTTPAVPLSDSVTHVVQQQVLEEEATTRTDSPTKKRSTSNPMPYQQSRVSPPAAIPVPNSGRKGLKHMNDVDDDDDDDDNHEFRPPHEMMLPNSFQVGTAYDVALWDRQRRRNLND